MTPEEKKQENPAAFPFKSIDFEASAEAKTNIYDGYSEGMTLRDYFAAKENGAEILADYTLESLETIAGRKRPNGVVETLKWVFELEAKVQFMKADAMLKARQL